MSETFMGFIISGQTIKNFPLTIHKHLKNVDKQQKFNHEYDIIMLIAS